MYLGSLESTQKARVALGCASRAKPYAFFVLSKRHACILVGDIRTLSLNKLNNYKLNRNTVCNEIRLLSSANYWRNILAVK